MTRMLIAFAVLCCLAISPVLAQDYRTVPMQPTVGTAPRLASPPGPVYSLGTPGVQRPPIHGQSGQPANAGQAWAGYGFGGVPTYQWGYFGAKYRPVKVYHTGYYGHRTSFGYRRGY